MDGMKVWMAAWVMTVCAATASADTTPAKALSPKEAFPKVIDSLVQGDLDALRAGTLASTGEAKTVLGWLEELAKAAAEARKVVLAKFGEEGKKQLDAHSSAFAKEDLAEMIEEIDGDNATLWLGDKEGNDPITMRRIDGVWKFDLTEMLKQESWKPEFHAKETTAAVKRLERFKARVEKGELKDAKDAAIWLRSAVLDSDENQPDREPEKEGL